VVVKSPYRTSVHDCLAAARSESWATCTSRPWTPGAPTSVRVADYTLAVTRYLSPVAHRLRL